MSLDEASIAEIKETYLMFDKTGGEKICVDEVGEIMRSCGLNPLGEDIKKFIDDVGKGGMITFEDYLGIHEECSKKGNPGSLNAFKEGWKCFDHEGNGFVDTAEVRHVLTTMGDVLSDEDIDMLLEGKENADGMVNYEEFTTFLMSG